MPNLPTHINFAIETASILDNANLEEYLGYFLVGSTSPDIRVITRRRREYYHFTDIDFEDVGTGVRGMFDQHPELQNQTDLNGPTRAFIAGYITHLLVDESYISDIFRPYFGNREVFQDSTTGLLHDRALQLDMDRQVWQKVATIILDLEFLPERVDVAFLAPDSLSQWRDWVFEVVVNGFSWDRLRFMAKRIAAGDKQHPVNQLVDDFLSHMPNSLDEIYEIVPYDVVSDFKTKTVTALLEPINGYLT